MAPWWRWFVVAVTVLALGLLAPGSMLAQPAASGRPASAEAVTSQGGSACTAVACNRGSTSSSGSVPTVAALGVLVAAFAPALLRRLWRRTRATAGALPAGSPFTLLRPPQRALLA